MLKTFKYRPLAALLAFAIISSPACGSLIDRKQRTLSSHGMRLSSTVTAIDEGTDTYATTDASYVVIESNGNTFITPITVPAANDSGSLDLSHPQIAASEPGTEINVIPDDGGCIAGGGCYAPLPDLNSSPAAQTAPATSTTSASASASSIPEYSDRGSGGSNLPPFEPSQSWPSPSVGNNDQPANQAPSSIPAPLPEVSSTQVPTNIDPPVVYVPNIPSPKNDQPDIPTYASANAAASVAMTAALATLNALQQQITDKLAKLVAESSSLLGDGRAVRQKQPVAEQGPLAPKDYPFKTPVDSPDGQRLAEGFIYKKYAEQNISSSDTRAKEKRQLVKAADAGLHQADNAFIRGARAEAEFLMNASIIALDIAISVGPLGWAKFGYETFTRKDFLTGHPLNSVSHGLAIAAFTVSIIAMAATAEIGLPVLAGAAGVELVADMIKASTELDAGAGATAEVAEISEAIKDAEGILDSANDIGWGASELKNLAKTASDVKRYGPLDVGILHDIPTPSGGSVADTFRSSSYFEVISKESVKMYRVYGGKAGELAQYWSRTKPTGPLQAQLDAALLPNFCNNAAKWVEIELPAGSKFFDGAASPQYLQSHGSNVPVGQLLGGGNQVYIPRVERGWITGGGTF